VKKLFATMTLLAVFMVVAAGGSYAERITFDDLVTSNMYSCKGVLFSTSEDRSFSPQTVDRVTDGQGLAGQSPGHGDLILDFESGDTNFLSFDFGLTTTSSVSNFGYVYIVLLAENGFPIISPLKVYTTEVLSDNGNYYQRGQVEINFEGTAKEAILDFTAMGGNHYVIDNLEGNFGTGEPPIEEPAISVFPEILDFGKVPVGSSSKTFEVFISNAGSGNLELGTISITGTHLSEFSLQNEDCSYQILAPGQTCTINAIFSPATKGIRSANLSILSNAPNMEHLDIALNGKGSQQDLIKIDSLVVQDFRGHILSGPLDLYYPILVTLTFSVIDNNNDNMIEINGVEYNLPFNVRSIIKGLGQNYCRNIKMNAGTYMMTEVFLPCPTWCERYARVNNFVLPLDANADIKGIVQMKKSIPGIGVMKIFHDDISAPLTINCDGYW